MNRTYLNHTFFGINRPGRAQLRALCEVIATKYTGIGYVQGINFLAAAILYHCDPHVALYFTSYLFEDCELCDVYREDMSGLHSHNKVIKNVIRMKCPEVYSHLVTQFDVEIECITTPWIIDLFSSLIPLDLYKFFLEKFVQDRWTFVYKLIASIFKELYPSLSKLDDYSDILLGAKDNIKTIDWLRTIKDSDFISLSEDEISSCHLDTLPDETQSEEPGSIWRSLLTKTRIFR